MRVENPLSWDYLTTVPGSDETFGPLATAYLIVFVLGLIGSIYLYNRPTILSSRHLLRRSTTRTWASVFIWIFVIGIFFFAVRWLQINPFGFGQRLWMYLSALAAIIAGVLVMAQIRVASPQLSTEVAQAQVARSRGVAGRRPPKRSRRRKR